MKQAVLNTLLFLALNYGRVWSVGDGGSADDASLDTLRSQCLLRHNQYRLRHKAEPLVISQNLNEAAQDYATRLAKAVGWVETSKTEDEVGESVFVTTEAATGFTPVDDWYSQEKQFSYGLPTPPNVQHVAGFSQIVWNASKELGVGRAVTPTNTTFIVCFYSPPGDILGEFAENVHEPLWLTGESQK